MILSGVFKLINQPAIRESKSGSKVCSLLLSAPYGRKQDGEKYKPTQLYIATLFGDGCETLLKDDELIAQIEQEVKLFQDEIESALERIIANSKDEE